MGFTYFNPVEIKFGTGKINELPSVIKEYGSKVLIVTGTAMRRTGVLDEVENKLSSAGIEYVLFEGVGEDPTADKINQGAKLAKEENVEVVIGFGGGSSIDTAKGISVVSTHSEDVLSYTVDGKLGSEQITDNNLPIIAIPTTAGTGSETNLAAVVTDTKNNLKTVLASPNLYADASIIDPELTLTLPKSVTFNTGIDALCQSIEAYVSKEANPIVEGVCLKSIELISNSLTKVLEDRENLEARKKMSLGATLSGIAISQSGVGAAHALSMVLGGEYGITHGLGIALVLPEVIDYNSEIRNKKYSKIAQSWGIDTKELSDKEAVDKLKEELKKLKEDNIDVKLRDFDINRDELLDLGRKACNHGDMTNNPREPEPEEMEKILRKVF